MKYFPMILDLKVTCSRLACLAGLVFCLTSVASAHQYYFQLKPAATTSDEALTSTSQRFSVYLDPYKTNWVAWSQLQTSREQDSASVLDSSAPGNIGFRDYFTVQMVSPTGERSPLYTLDANTADGVSYGQQAVLFGRPELTPHVVRSTPKGQIQWFDESGVANDFMLKHGAGYYTLDFNFYAHDGKPAPPQNGVYLLMDVVEGFRFPGPWFDSQIGGNPLGLNADDNNDNDNDNNDGGSDNGGGGGGGGGDDPVPTPTPIPTVTPTPIPTSTPTPIPTPDDRDLRIPSNPFPSVDDEPDEPVVPEPTTLVLSGLGLAALGWVRRRTR